MGLVIAGMHRSGTSAVARIVNGLGLAMASARAPGQSMEAAPDNPRGFFERVDVMQINDAWLASLGGAWWAPPVTSESTWSTLDRGVLAAQREAIGLFDPDGPAWFVKDPRISLLLPVWDRLALQELPVIVAVRNPLEVASSLRLRDGMTPTRALALWYEYQQRLLTHASDRPVLVVDYAQLLEAPAASVAAISRFTQETTRSGPSLLNSDELARLVDPRLQRNRPTTVRGLHEADVEAALEAYRELSKLHGQELDRPPTPPQPPAWVGAVLAEARETSLLTERLAEAERNLQVSAAEVQVLREGPRVDADSAREVAELQRELGGLRELLEAERAGSAARELEALSARDQVAELQRELRGLRELQRELGVLRELLEAERARSQESVQEGAARIAGLLADVARRELDLAEAAEQLAGARADLVRLGEELDRSALVWRRAVLERDLARRARSAAQSEHRRILGERDRAQMWLRGELDRSRSLVGELAASRTSVRAELGSVEARLAKAREGLRHLTEELHEARSARVRMAGELSRAQGERDAMRIERQVLSVDLQRTQASRSYRLGRRLSEPLRRFRGGRVGQEHSPEDISLIIRSGLFDADWYAQHSPDVSAAGLDPFDHYLHQGWRELRSPGPRFDAAWYAAHHEVPAGVNPLLHFLRTTS